LGKVSTALAEAFGKKEDDDTLGAGKITFWEGVCLTVEGGKKKGGIADRQIELSLLEGPSPSAAPT